MSYMYSITTKGFYPASKEEQQVYIDAGTLPDDLKEISDKDYQNYFNPPEGYYSVFDEQGPRLIEFTSADYVAQAEGKREQLLSEATEAITIWQTKLLMGRKLTDSETTQLSAWMDYIDDVSAVDVSGASKDGVIAWPEKPDFTAGSGS